MNLKMIKIKHTNDCNKLFVYKKASVMINHNFTDDVAIVYATSRADAYRKFSKAYDLKIAILTDY